MGQKRKLVETHDAFGRCHSNEVDQLTAHGLKYVTLPLPTSVDREAQSVHRAQSTAVGADAQVSKGKQNQMTRKMTLCTTMLLGTFCGG